MNLPSRSSRLKRRDIFKVGACVIGLAGVVHASSAEPRTDKIIIQGNPAGTQTVKMAAFVGQKEVALDAIFLEAELSVIDIAGLIWTPVYQPLRAEPRFLEFLKKMKMPEYWRATGWSEFCRPKGDNDFECIGK